MLYRAELHHNGSGGRARTCDMVINSDPLCQLSYSQTALPPVSPTPTFRAYPPRFSAPVAGRQRSRAKRSPQFSGALPLSYRPQVQRGWNRTSISIGDALPLSYWPLLRQARNRTGTSTYLGARRVFSRHRPTGHEPVALPLSYTGKTGLEGRIRTYENSAPKADAMDLTTRLPDTHLSPRDRTTCPCGGLSFYALRPGAYADPAAQRSTRSTTVHPLSQSLFGGSDSS